jgi:hypothetical protein
MAGKVKVSHVQRALELAAKREALIDQSNVAAATAAQATVAAIAPPLQPTDAASNE